MLRKISAARNVACIIAASIGSMIAMSGVLADCARAAEGSKSLDPNLQPYEKASTDVSGSIKSVGSDTMNNLMDHWSASFSKIYPNVQREIEGKGSATAPPALIEGTANFGPMSREWKKGRDTSVRGQVWIQADGAADGDRHVGRLRE